MALVPGVFWMPLPGVAVGGDEPGRYGNDYFTMDLQVSVPPTWLVAGPGRRVGEAGEFRFKPAAPVPAIGLWHRVSSAAPLPSRTSSSSC